MHCIYAACVLVVFGAFGPVLSTVTKNVNETEMFYYEIQPEFFNWTNGILVFEILGPEKSNTRRYLTKNNFLDADAKFVYTPSLQNYPDLPPWIHYKFNNKNRHGYLYGTPPVASTQRQIQVKYFTCRY